MDFELPYLAQRRIQAKRMGRLFPEGVQEEDDEPVLFSVTSDDDDGLEEEWDRREQQQGAAALLGGGRGGGGAVAAMWSSSVVERAGAAGAPYPRPAAPPVPVDLLVRLGGCPLDLTWAFQSHAVCPDPTSFPHTTN